MLVLFASRHDATADALLARWADHGATLLTPLDLSRAGWRHFLDAGRADTAVVGGRVVACEEITGVLVRWPCVYERELSQIDPGDRAYVAREMTAFLTSWLTRLRCPVLNRPTPTSLLGPSWRPEQWVQAAARAAIPVHVVERRVRFSSPGEPASSRAPGPPPCTVTVVGDRWFGAADPVLAVRARLLADAAGVDLLAVSFDRSDPDALLIGADLWPDLTSDDVADAVLAYFVERRTGS
jgi:hypothetical protein